MKIEFNNDELADIYEGKKPKSTFLKSNTQLVKQFIKCIKQLEAVDFVEQLNQFGGLHYEKLLGDRKGQSSVRINQQYRLIFIEVENQANPPKVELFEIEEISKHYD